MGQSDDDTADKIDDQRRVQLTKARLGVGQWNLFTTDDQEHLLANLAPVVTTGVSLVLAAWGLLTLVGGTRPPQVGAAALVGGAVLFAVTDAFTSGTRWALPVVAVAPLGAAAGLYVILTPTFPMRGPSDLLAWLTMLVCVVAPVTLAVGPVHPSWVDEG